MRKGVRRLSVRSAKALVVAVIGVTVLALNASAGTGPGAASPTLAPKVKTGSLKGFSTAASRSAGAPSTSVTASGATRLGFCGGDDWEPEIAADQFNHVYAVFTHFPGDTSCDHGSGRKQRVYIQVSNDGGRTFGRPHVVTNRPGGTNYPQQVDNVVTTNGNGVVFVSMLAYGVQGVQTDVVVARSTDFGKTFSLTRKINSPPCRNCDHPWIVARGNDVYVAYASLRNHYLAHSSDLGRTWHQSNVLRTDAVAFPEGGVVDHEGNAWFAWGDCISSSCQKGKLAGHYRVSRTLAGTSLTTFALVASAPAGPRCPFNPNCGFAYFGIQNDIAIDAADNLYMVWQDGQDHLQRESPTIVQLSMCPATRNCTRSSAWRYVGRADDKSRFGCPHNACYALFPRVEGGAPGHIAVMWMDDRNGQPLNHMNGWNVWLRTSETGGRSWTGPSRRVSQFVPSVPESHPRGFEFPYGDYEGIDLTPSGRAVMVWGEGFNYAGGPSAPGHVVYRSMAT